jgi:preprotein translocase subunit SecD
VIALALVAIFMVLRYKAAGAVAVAGMAVTLIGIVASLGLLRAVLTLPGIAGIALTIAMAVDANVLIFERMREELRTGKTFRAALDAGYDRAWSAIFDANLTTLIAALALYWWGSGPIRGFAVTLSAGVIWSFFSAIFVTRVVLETILARGAQRISL